MKKISISTFFFLGLFVFLLSSCRTQFEKIRTSQNPSEILTAADNYYDEKEWYKAQLLYELVIPNYRGQKEAENIFYNFAYTHYHLREYILAAHYFKSFTRSFGNSDRKEEMDYMAAYSNYKLSPNYKLDQSYSIKAIEGLQEFTNKYPLSERVTLCNDLIDEIRDKMEIKSYEEGKLYFKMKNYRSAITSFGNMLKDFPESPKGEEARYLIAKSSFLLASNSIYSKQKERFEETIELSNKFLDKYPKSSYYKEVNSFVEKAINESKKFTNGRS